ncbi:hypothetical protein PRV_00215 [Mycoplasma parvum str. Indiana]|uniref:Uncharacterized protein n=1 Tax=Mycoplasma parvum str. Indiana TaxID=1403316 RepID=U5NF60_9MOLU|nr:hypothetical protein PRV_00215 [Mycoplasma parvum str. Indiana]
MPSFSIFSKTLVIIIFTGGTAGEILAGTLKKA